MYIKEIRDWQYLVIELCGGLKEWIQDFPDGICMHENEKKVAKKVARLCTS